MLGRNSLLISQEAIRDSIEVIAKDQPWEHFVRCGQAMVANSARKILIITIEGADHQLRSTMPTPSIILHACFVLYVNSIRHPGARMVKVDQAVSHADSHFRYHSGSQLRIAHTKCNQLHREFFGRHKCE